MRNRTIKESKCADSLWRQAPDIKRTLKGGALRVIWWRVVVVSHASKMNPRVACVTNWFFPQSLELGQGPESSQSRLMSLALMHLCS